jgi:23S rRNA (pseudouridine1915-N3)-methyltransferase
VGSVHILAIGKLRPALRVVADEYLRRLGRYVRVEERELPEAGKAGNATAQRREEAARLLGALPADAVVIALTREGDGWSSADLARRLGRWRDGSRPVAFLIGGAEGLAGDLLEQATQRWSLSPLTLPHELARVVVLEQIYRGFTILAGEKYHKAR